MIKLNPEKEVEVLIDVATKMCVAARTAPKANGLDSIVTAIVYGDELEKIKAEMERAGKERSPEYSLKSNGVADVKVVVLIGTKLKEKGNGFDDGESVDVALKESAAIDLGIAIGAACYLAKECCVDNRVMGSIGSAAKNLKILGDDIIAAYGIPLSISGKSPFFDRK